MRTVAAFLAILIIAACSNGNSIPTGNSGIGKPERIVSLDYCADQFVLKFADPANILAVSPDADKDFSYMRAAAGGVRSVRPRVEDVLMLRPDLVVRSYGGGPNAAQFFERVGIPVLNVGWAANIDDVKANTLRMATELGEPEKGQATIDNMSAQLATITPSKRRYSALYTTSGGVTSGPGSLVHEMIVAAGLRNFEAKPGWRPIPLEHLTRERPDIVASAFSNQNYTDPWGAMRHPIARDLLKDYPVAELDGAWTACGGWYLVNAIAEMAETARDED